MSAASVRLAGCAALLLACQAPVIPEGTLGCATRSDCPSGWTCGADGLCWSESAAPDAAIDVDAAPGDGDGDIAMGHDGGLDAMIDDAGEPDADAAAPSACDGKDGDPCDDGWYCTVNDTCQAGVCAGTSSRSCGDGVACNGDETCDEQADACAAGEVTCEAPLLCDVASDTCVTSCPDCTIGGSCLADGAVSTLNPCLICDSALDGDAWSFNDGVRCGDDAETECSAADTCSMGECDPNHAGSGVDCGASATECSGQDTCDGNGSCAPNHFDGTTACGEPVTRCRNARFCLGNGSCSEATFGATTRTCEADDDPRTMDHCSGTNEDCVIGPDYCDANHCWNVPPTGQTHCYNTTVEITCPGTAGSASCGETSFCGQDAQIADPARTFTCKAAGGTTKTCAAGSIAAGDMVEDSVSQLTWQRVIPSSYPAPCDGGAGCGFYDAIDYCEELTYGGFSDWRLPDNRELMSIANYNWPATPGNEMPLDSVGGSHWSRTLHQSTLEHGNFCSLNGTYCNLDALEDEYIARCVRGPGGPTNIDSRFYVMGEEPERTVFDRATRLEWRALHEENTTWVQALAFCEGLDYAGHSDWQLPNQAQIYSLTNYDEDQYPTSDFPGMTGWDYWSSTTYVSAPINAYTARNNYAYHTWTEKTYAMGVALCVRIP